MTWPLLVLTHALAASFGAVVTYMVTLYAKGERSPSQPDGSKSVTEQGRSRRLGATLLVAALVVIAIGVQARLAQQDNAQRDRQEARRSMCLNHFAATLIDTINTRSEANADLLAANKAKDDATDQVVAVVAAANFHPPKSPVQIAKIEDEFTAALHRFTRAKAALLKVQATTKATLATNPYVNPRTVCR